MKTHSVLSLTFLVFCLSCCQDQRKLNPVRFAAPSTVTRENISSVTPDGLVLTTHVEDLNFLNSERRQLNKTFTFSYLLKGYGNTIKVKNDLRYAIVKDTSSSVVIRIRHHGKEYPVTLKGPLNEIQAFTFIETIPCDSFGIQNYDVSVMMENTDAGKRSSIKFDSWEVAMINE